MKSVGLITEYNPFHNGHMFHLQKAKELTNADCIIAVMSGDFVQRGEPAIIDKYTRAAAAIDSGVNLVIELPVSSALSSAEGFAFGAVSILDALGVNAMVFGSECGDLEQLQVIAELLSNETPAYQAALNTQLASGKSYPVARQLAVSAVLSPSSVDDGLSNILSSPNNILGIEYLKAIKKRNASITPYTITREGTGYNETEIHGLPSASAIRASMLCDKGISSDMQAVLPSAMYAHFQEQFSHGYRPLTMDDFSLLFAAKMNEIIYKHHCNKEEIIAHLCTYPDISKELASRMYRCFTGCESISNYCLLVKSKQYTYSRISRGILHILLGLTSEARQLQQSNPYIRILGFDQTGMEYLSSIKKDCPIPMITKVSDHTQLLLEDIRCSHIYNEVMYHQCGYSITDEYRHGIYIKK